MRSRLDIRSERGVALVAAIIVSGIVLALGIGALAIADFTNRITADDRAVTQSLHAAEAGVNRVIEQFALDFPNNGSCTAGPSGPIELTDDGETTALLEYTVEGVPGDATCATDQRRIRAWGWVGDYRDVRTVEVDVEVTLESGFRYAVFSGCPAGATGCGGITLQPNLTVSGNIYAETFDASQPNYDATGNVVTPGEVFTKPNSVINGNVTAGGQVTIANGVQVFGNIRSATDSVTLGNNAEVDGNVQAGTTVTDNGATVTGSTIGDQPSSPPLSEPFPVFDEDDPNLPGPRRTFDSVLDAAAHFAINPDLEGTYIVRASSSNAVLELTTAHNIIGPTTIVASQEGAAAAPKIRFGDDWATTGSNQLVVVGMNPDDDAIQLRKSRLPVDLCTLHYTVGGIRIEQRINMRGALYATTIHSQPNAEVSHCPDLVANPPAGFIFPVAPGEKYDVLPILWRERSPTDPPSAP